ERTPSPLSPGRWGSPAPPASPASVTTTPPGTAAATASLWLGLVDGQGAAVHLLAVEGGDGGLGLLVRLHLDEGEALGLPRVTVRDDLGRLHPAVLPEQLLQVAGGDGVGQVADIKLFPHHQTP